MKHSTRLALVVALALGAGSALAQQKMGDMPMKDMPMKDMPMKDMPMKDMPMGASSQGQTHQASGTVKMLDAGKGTVTFDHEPVKSLNWPAMTMTFAVRDKMLLDKLTLGKKAEFEFVQDGKGYVVTGVK